jgi:myosin-5
VRYTLDMIYTYSGNILIAVCSQTRTWWLCMAKVQLHVRLAPARPELAPCAQANPHKRLRQLYGPRMMMQYRGVPLGELSPHAYAIAEQASAPGPHAPKPPAQHPICRLHGPY